MGTRAGPDSVNEDGTYVCQSCGEEIVVPVDPSAGGAQEYVEDCPVCCRPHVLVVQIDPDGSSRIDARSE